MNADINQMLLDYTESTTNTIKVVNKINISTSFIITKSIGIVLSRMDYFVRPFQ